MVDDLTQESFQTGKALVTVSVDLIMSIAEALKKAEQQNPQLSGEQKDTLMKKVVENVTERYRETHGSLKSFNRQGKEVASLDVTDEKAAMILEASCKKNRIPVDLKPVVRSDGSMSFTAFCEVKNIEQLSSLLKLASEQVLEEQKAITKDITLFNEKGEAILVEPFVKETDIRIEKIEEVLKDATKAEITDYKKEVLFSSENKEGIREALLEKAKELSPKKEKNLADRIKNKKEQIKAKDKNRVREKTKKKTRDASL